MQANLGSETQTNAGRTAPYTVLTLEGKNYRILTRQYQGYLQMQKIWGVFWYLFASFLLGSALITFFSLKISFILILAFVCTMIFGTYGYKMGSQISQSIFYSSINILVWLIPVIVLVFLSIKQIIIPLCFYILIETFLSIKYMSNKSQMVAKFLIMMEAVMITLKADEKIQSSWRDVLFSHVVFFLFFALCLLLMTAYLIYMKWNQNQQNLMKHKFPGALFIYFNTIGFCTLSALPLFIIFFEFSIWTVCFALSFEFFALATYIVYYRKEIVIFFCTLNEIKSFNQIISFEAIQNIKSPNASIGPKKSEQRSEAMYMYRISQNWLTTSPQKASQSQVQNPEIQKDEQNDKITDCTICLDKHAQVVWMPCGHLTVCMECCSFMFQKRNFNCVLCKKTPTQIFIIDVKDKSQNNQNTNDASFSIQKDDVSVISDTVMMDNEKKSEGKKQLFDSLTKNCASSKKILTKSIGRYRVLEGYNVKIA